MHKGLFGALSFRDCQWRSQCESRETQGFQVIGELIFTPK